MFENPKLSTIASLEDGLSCDSDTHFVERFSLIQFSVKEVFDALASIDLKKAYWSRSFEYKSLGYKITRLLAAPIIAIL